MKVYYNSRYDFDDWYDDEEGLEDEENWLDDEDDDWDHNFGPTESDIAEMRGWY